MYSNAKAVGCLALVGAAALGLGYSAGKIFNFAIWRKKTEPFLTEVKNSEINSGKTSISCCHFYVLLLISLIIQIDIDQVDEAAVVCQSTQGQPTPCLPACPDPPKVDSITNEQPELHSGKYSF